MESHQIARAIYQTRNGSTFRCEGESTIRLEFKNLIFTFLPEGLQNFKTFVDSVDIEASEAMESNSVRTRKIVLEVKSAGMMFAFFKTEFLEFKLLLEGTQARLALYKYAREAKISVN